MIYEITIQEYINIHENLPLIDVRSPGEYEKGHILDAQNIPLFSNKERAHVGTVYVQQSKEKAIEIGYEYVTPKLKWFVDESERVSNNKRVAVHCWRGGMRSRSFAELLDENGFEVYLIQKGYKAFRNHVIEIFNKPINLQIIGGYTGSGKTKILVELEKRGHQVVDFEGLANHKGSAFGRIGAGNQPQNEQFENSIFRKLMNFDLSKPVWIEDESSNIGGVNIPQDIYRLMRDSVVYFLNIPKRKRAEFLEKDYIDVDNNALVESIQRISKRLGGLKTKQSLENLEQRNYYQVALICLDYYDKYYLKGLRKREQSKVCMIEANTVDTLLNTQKILDSWKKLN